MLLSDILGEDVRFQIVVEGLYACKTTDPGIEMVIKINTFIEDRRTIELKLNKTTDIIIAIATLA